jgi:hypothetical protein
VVKGLFNKLKKLLGRGQESFLIIEEFGPGFVVTKAKLKNKDKKIRILGTDFFESFEEIKKPVLRFDKAILAVGSRRAVTIEGVIRLKRNEPEQQISETELDTLVFRGLWEFLNRYRSTVSKKLGCHDLDLVLAGAEIREVALGSYRVFNPAGFKGANLNLRYRGTFIRRELKALVEKMEHWAGEKILVESGSIFALSVPRQFDYFGFVGDKVTDIFVSEEDERLHLKTISWGTDRILKKVALLFGVGAETALKILLTLDEKPPARKVRMAIERQVKQEVKNLLKALPQPSRRGAPPAFYLSFNLPLGSLEKFVGPRFKVVNFKSWLTEQGYGIIGDEGNESTLVLITHVYSPPQYRALNELLSRRARWLTAQA